MASECIRGVVAAAAGLLVGVSSPMVCAGGDAPAPASVKELMTRDLIGASGKEIRMLTVEYIPGGASLPHRHNAQVFVYVLEGAVVMQVQGQAAVTLGPGETFYEGPEDIHTVSANASKTKPARILVFMIKDATAPASIAVPAKSAR
jgi:quercetin dioxygenase-like cupin family protein